jgi:hypothetical protein
VITFRFVNCRAKFAEEALLSNKGMNALFFATGALTVLGYLFFMFYTAVGMVTLPLNMIRSRGKMSSARASFFLEIVSPDFPLCFSHCTF